jgi:hypothetical protein
MANRSVNHHQPVQIDEVNDIRNGLLLHSSIHRGMENILNFCQHVPIAVRLQLLLISLNCPNQSMTRGDVDIRIDPWILRYV